jgi:pyrimidine-nucleoside phosphorylase
MLFQEIIAHKRDGEILTPSEIAAFIGGYTRGSLPDYQASALLMAIYLRGLNAGETAALTGAMAESGETLDLAALEATRPTLDKHSTGGVGDKTSLVVVPILAAAGAAVCKMSGRGLGHTGGTLDKLESIPGFRVALTPAEMIAQVRQVGACLAGQTGDLAPADKKLYALRDATATVNCLPLIVSSILSKKLAGGARRFLFDVKTGNGALMKQTDEAHELAQALVAGAAAHGRAAVAILTDMSQPLGRAIGNALEVREAIELLSPATAGHADGRFREICLHLSAAGIHLAGLAADTDEARKRAEQLLRSGEALRVFRRIVEAQGGDPAYVDAPERLAAAPIVHTVRAPRSGFIAEIDSAALGFAVAALGGGRARKEDAIDPAVGMTVRVEVGSEVAAGDPLLQIHARTANAASEASRVALAAYHISGLKVDKRPLVIGHYEAGGVIPGKTG